MINKKVDRQILEVIFNKESIDKIVQEVNQLHKSNNIREIFVVVRCHNEDLIVDASGGGEIQQIGLLEIIKDRLIQMTYQENQNE